MVNHRDMSRENKTSRITLGFDKFTRQAIEALAKQLSLRTSDVIRDAVVSFTAEFPRGTSFEERSVLTATSKYGEVKSHWAEVSLTETTGRGPTPRFTERLSVAFPESVYAELEEICIAQHRGITQVIRLAVDNHLSREIFEKTDLEKYLRSVAP